MVHCACFCTIAFPNVARFILIHATRPEETGEDLRVPHDREPSGRAIGFVNGRLALFLLLSYALRKGK